MNRIALGATIKVTVSGPGGTHGIHRVVGSGGSFGASPIRRQEIGLDAAQAIEKLEITWLVPGETQVITGLELDSTYAIRQGEPAGRRVKLTSFPWPQPGVSMPHRHHH